MALKLTVNNKSGQTMPVKNLSADERRAIESSPLLVSYAGYDNSVATSQNGSVAGGVVAKNISLAGFAVPPTRKYWVPSVTITSTVAIDLLLQIDNSAFMPPGGTSRRTITVKLAANETKIIPYNDFVSERSGFFLVTNASVAAGNWAVNFSIPSAVNLTNEQNVSADKTIGCFGDSIWTAQGPTYGNQYAPFIIRDWYFSGNGPGAMHIDVRLIVKGNGGYNFANIIEIINTQGGWMGKLDLLLLNIGMNDAVAYSTTPSIFQGHMSTFMAWRNTFYKNVPLVICGPSPRQDAYEGSGLIPMRTWITSFITSLVDPTVRGCNLANGFDRTINSNYTDGTGSNGIHPSAAGQWICANNLKAALTASPAITLL